jgi:hypothetical protein
MRQTSGTQARRRPWHLLLVGVLLVPTGGGCASNAGTGAAAGGLLGAGAGALIGHSPGAALVGGALGAGAGLVGGALVDNAQAKSAARADAQARQAIAARAPSLEDIVRMTQSNVPDANIIDQIRNSGVVYNLSADNIIYLKNNGVSPPVISALQNGGPVAVRYAPPPTTVIVEERPYYPPPPAYVGVGIRGRW